MFQTHSARIILQRLFPFLSWLKSYQISFLHRDALAGLTVAVVLIPQAMAYAMLAGMPPVHGLYAAAITPFIAALWGSLSQLATGPIAIMSLLVLTTLSPIAEPGSTQFVQLAFLLAFLVGILYLAVGFSRLGELMSFISHAAVKGFTSAAAHGKSQGSSVNGLMANLNGAFGAVMGEGYLTKYLDLLSVDLAQKVIPIWGSHKKANEINCAVVQFDIKNGVAESRAFVFVTQIGVLSAEGEINLGSEQVNFSLVPKPKIPGLLSLSTKLRVSGTILHPKVHPDTLSLATKGAKALSFLAVGPLGLLAPFVHLGAFKKHPCDIQSIGQLGVQVPAPE